MMLINYFNSWVSWGKMGYPDVPTGILPQFHSNTSSLCLPRPSNAKPTLRHLLMDYYEGEFVCLRVDLANVEEIAEILKEYAEEGGWKEVKSEAPFTVDPRLLLKRCTEVQNGAPPFYLQGSEMRAIPLGKIPPYIHRVIHPGFLLDKSGTRAHLLNEHSLQELEKVHKLISPYFSQSEAVSQKVSDPDNKGILINLNSPGSKYNIVVHIDKQKKKNHETAFSYLEGKIVQGSSFSSQTSEEIINTLKETHRLMGKEMIRNAGKLRTRNIFVFEEAQVRNQETLEKLIWEKGGNHKHIKAFRSASEKEKKYANNFPDYLTKEEKEAYSLVAYFTPSPKKISQLLKRFASKLKQKEKTLSAIGLAAYAHTQIGRIHPFSDGNGRVARAFMNAILMRGGHNPIVFPNDNEYTQVVQNEAANPGSFEAYLQNKIIPWNRENRGRLTGIF